MMCESPEADLGASHAMQAMEFTFVYICIVKKNYFLFFWFLGSRPMQLPNDLIPAMQLPRESNLEVTASSTGLLELP